MTNTNLTSRTITRDETVPLRHSVLRPDAALDAVYFPGDEAEGVLHAGALLDGELVAVGSISPEPRGADAPGGAPQTLIADEASAWRVRGMATADWARSRGAGALVLARCTEHARASGARIIWCNARIGAVGFYERAGWVAVSEKFELEGVGPHVVMEYRVTG